MLEREHDCAKLHVRAQHDLADLYSTFEQKVHAIAAKYNKSVMAWDEVFSTAQSVLPETAIVCVYRGVPTLKLAVQAGFRAVQTAGFYLNTGFDYRSVSY